MVQQARPDRLGNSVSIEFFSSLVPNLFLSPRNLDFLMEVWANVNTETTVRLPLLY